MITLIKKLKHNSNQLLKITKTASNPFYNNQNSTIV